MAGNSGPRSHTAGGGIALLRRLPFAVNHKEEKRAAFGCFRVCSSASADVEPGPRNSGPATQEPEPNPQRSAEMTSFVLDEESFYQCCQLLLQQSQQLRDDWNWEPGQGAKEGYLRKTAVRSVITDSEPQWEPETFFGPDHQGQELQQHHPAAVGRFHGNHDDDDDDGVAAVASKSCCHVHRYEYHILYSCSFRTPVLYFRASTLEGRSLSLEEVWSSVHQNYRRRLQHHPLDTITQQEHPVLGQPFFMLHPCRTEEFMRPLLQVAQQEHRSVNYVLSWLSVVGPLVGLDVPLSYCLPLCPTEPE